MSGKAVRETLGFLAVVAGLVFVGVEIRQNTQVARAQMRQALAEATMSLGSGVFNDAELNRQLFDWLSATEGIAPDCRETRVCMYARTIVRHHENVFLQVQEGLLDESAYLSYGYTATGVYESPHFPFVWQNAREALHPDFVATFEAEYDLAP